MPPTINGERIHILGTDLLGRDEFTQLMLGGRLSLFVGLSTAFGAGLLGTSLGMIAGYYRGPFEILIMRISDIELAFPFYLLAIVILFIAGSSVWNLILILIFMRWMVYARVCRGLVLSLNEDPFIMAARAVGCSNSRIMLKHLLPQIYAPMIMIVTLEVARMILAEAALSFLGVGIQPPQISWGVMLSQSREYITNAWWLITIPGLVIFLTALSMNLIASWVRVALDPIAKRTEKKIKAVY
jgi:peptide/nickel transport system permease protein